jgi:hypothetical protein
MGRRPWRCSATVLVSRTRGRLAGERTNTRCAPFPPPAAVPDPAAALGTAFALDAPVCRELRLQHDAQAVGRAQLLGASGAADHHGVEARAFGWLGVGAA